MGKNVSLSVLERINKLLKAKGDASQNLNRALYIWKEKDGNSAPVYLADKKKDTFAMPIGTVSDWKNAESRANAVEFFMGAFPDLPKSIRVALDKDDGKVTLKSAVKDLLAEGFEDYKLGFGEAPKKPEKKESSKKVEVKSKAPTISRKELIEKASKIAKEQGVEVLTAEEVSLAK